MLFLENVNYGLGSQKSNLADRIGGSTWTEMSLSGPAAALTELGGDDGDVVPSVFLSVQLPEDEHWPVACMDVEHSVHVCAPINSVPAQNTQTTIGV